MNAADVVKAAIRALENTPFVDERSLLAGLAAIPVSVSTSVPTAAIRNTGTGYEIALNPEFCARYVRDDASALALIGHELMHARRGHFGLTTPRAPGERALLNIALDVLVNATLLRTWLPHGCPLFRDVNAWDRFPSCFLVPPMDILVALRSYDGAAKAQCRPQRGLIRRWLAAGAARSLIEGVFTRHFESLKVHQPGPMARLYLRGWLEVLEPTEWWVLFRQLMVPELQRRGDALGDVCLLGDHETTGERGRGLPCPTAGEGSDAGDELVRTRRPPDAVRRAFFRAVQRALVDGASATSTGACWLPTPGVMPGVGRREVIALAAGVMPALWSPSQAVSGDGDAGVHLFVDVSGSTLPLQGVYFGLAAALGPQLVRPAWLFSTQVFPANEADIRGGRVRTSRGTDITCVIEHAKKHAMRRVLLLTDGIFQVSPRLAHQARGMKIVMLLTHTWGDPLRAASALGATTVVVPPAMFASARHHGADDIPF